MINQYSFNLDAPQDDYLCHDKLGAHYSKNWDKAKQDAYNKWYYEHNKEKWKPFQDRLTKARLNAAKNMKEDYQYITADLYNKNKQIQETKARGYNQIANQLESEAATLRKLRKDYTDQSSSKYKGMSRIRSYDANRQAEALSTLIKYDRNRLSNKVRYDAETTAAKAKANVETTAAKAKANISSTINKIKNKVLK